ncbi:MAG TPA: AAA family ATPase [Acidimicrobiales bacterium]|nr:AAA family ATPase [Acidimicrobiales bacterium]
MIVRHLYLQNYRVYEGVCELDLPEGLVGVYGPNGAGKSYLIEAIPWALYGHARGPVEEVRTTGVNDECVVEITFEHEGQTYVARRTLKGGLKPKHDAVMHCNGQQVAIGARDVSRYVQSVIGMNEKGFLASVFAEQKQLAALSAQQPGDRRRLVLDLLGITPIEAAVKNVRRDAKDAAAILESIEGVASDLEALATERDDAMAKAGVAEAEQITADEVARVAVEKAEEARERFAEISSTIEEGKRVKAQFDKLDADVQKLEAHAATLATAREELAALGDTAAALSAAREAHAAVTALAKAQATFDAAAAALAKSGSAEPPDDTAAITTRQAASAAAETAAGLVATAQALQANLRAAQANLERTDALEGDADCPTCGQPLGDAFAEVRAHRVAEVAAARDAASDATAKAKAAQAEAKALAAAAEVAERELAAARAAWDNAAKLVAAERAAADALARAREAAAGREELAAGLAACEQADRRAQQLVGELSRAEVVAAELTTAQRERDEVARDLEARRAAAKAHGFTAAGLAEADETRRVTAAAAAEASERAKAAAVALGQARGRAQEKDLAYARAQEQHARIEPQKVEARLLGRLGELLNAFKDSEAASVGPRLAGHARALFSDMTEGTYDTLDLSDSFEVRITDQNHTFDLKRFSGSEVDLANLALRIAISECVTLQSGGAVGLLVLDEVFGPLDAGRRVRLLQALNGLQTRFRQVLVVTHADDVKAQLPSSIEVRPTGERRSTAIVT